MIPHGLAACAVLAVAACDNISGGGGAEDAQRLAALNARLDTLEASVTTSEDEAAIKRLMRTYSFYLDRGLWTDLTELMTDDARGSYPAGVFIGKASLAPHFMDNNGRGYLGFEDGRLGNHIALQPVVTMNPDGVTASARWRVLAQLGQYGQSANWAGGVYENTFRKENGIWKISGLRYYGGFGGPYDGGWTAVQPAPERPGAATFANLPHPADEPAERDCIGYPNGTCIPPFSFPNPGSGRAWTPLPQPAAQETQQ